MLYLVGTPIGNMGDFSDRAKEILASSDLIACEDTRRTGLLLQNFGIEGKLFSYHEHNKAAKGPVLISMLKDGKTVSLVSDAGMPSINDPGEDLVKLAIENDLEISVVPGPVAAITALVMSGLSTVTFHYEGFLPSESSPRKQRLEAITKINETIILYEAPHRLKKLVSELEKVGFGDSKAAFCRELTKKYEEVLRMTISEAVDYYSLNEPRGEYVICLEAMKHEDKVSNLDDNQIDEMIYKLNSEGKSTKEISKELSEITGRNKKEMYLYIVNLLK